MPAITPNRYPLDYTGQLDSNLIENEQVTLLPGAYRAFSPLYSPFFKKNIRIIDAASGLVLQSSQYRCLCISSAASTIAGVGNEVFSIVVITDEAVSNNLAVDYQSVGGAYTTGYEAILGMINNLLSTTQVSNNDPVDWSLLENLPSGFAENLHLHSLGSTAGWEFLAASLEKLRLAVLLGDQTSKSFVMSYIDQAVAEMVQMRANISAPGTPFGDHVSSTDNPHSVNKAQVNLSLVENYPIATMTEAYEGVRNDRYLTADQVKQVVQDRVDMGLHAHVIDTNNPHNVTKAQVGLDLVQNLGVASTADMASSSTTTYVTNQSAYAFLTDYFATLNSANNTTLQGVQDSADATLAAAQTALVTANNALSAVQAATTTITAASVAASNAVESSNNNLVNVQNSESAALQMLQEYTVSAVIQAEAESYARGYKDGVASRS